MDNEEFPKTIDINEQLQLFTSGAKKPQSMFEKFDGMPSEAKLGDIKDLVRVTLLVEGYGAVPSLIADLSKMMRNLHGDISCNNSGYRGVHVQILYEGVRAEIQICTPKVLEAKQKDDKRYHRKKEVDYQVDHCSESMDPYNYMLLTEEKKFLTAQKLYSKKVFRDYYTEANLPQFLPKIRALLMYHSQRSYQPQSYPLAVLNETQKDIKVCEEAYKETKVLQENMTEELQHKLANFRGLEIETPSECERYKECFAELRREILGEIEEREENPETFVENGIKSMTKFEDRVVANYGRECLKTGDWTIPKSQVDESTMDELVEKMKKENNDE